MTLDDGAMQANHQSVPIATSGIRRRSAKARPASTTNPAAAARPSGSAAVVTVCAPCMIDCPTGQSIKPR